MASPIDITVTAEAVAWYAAIVATVGFILSAYMAYRDRAQLRITVSPNMIALDGPEDEAGACLMVHIANRGRRPVTVDAVGLIPKDPTRGEFLLTDSVQPRTITEGKAESYLLRHSILEDQEIHPEDLKRVIVRDQTGRIWGKRL